MTQAKQVEWFEQWKILEDDELFLFNDWIFPYTLDDFSGKKVLECGCGGGQHTSFIAPFAKNVTSVILFFFLNCVQCLKKSIYRLR